MILGAGWFRVVCVRSHWNGAMAFNHWYGALGACLLWVVVGVRSRFVRIFLLARRVLIRDFFAIVCALVYQSY